MDFVCIASTVETAAVLARSDTVWPIDLADSATREATILADSDVFDAAKDNRYEAERVALDKATFDADRILWVMGSWDDGPLVVVSNTELGTPVSERALFSVVSRVDFD